MQRVWSFPLLVAVVVVALIVSTRSFAPDASAPATAPVPSAAEAGAAGSRRSAKVSFEVQPYVDPDFGFSLAVPAGWYAVVAAEDDERMAMLEPGYAVGFRSPREHAGDRFADYLMVEIMPGRESGLFETDGSHHREVVIDGHPGWRDELTLPGGALGIRPLESEGEAPVDLLPVAGAPSMGAVESLALLVRQAAISGLGYTIGFYAIGEPSRRSTLDDAFETMLRTFRLPHPPFDVS